MNAPDRIGVFVQRCGRLAIRMWDNKGRQHTAVIGRPLCQFWQRLLPGKTLTWRTALVLFRCLYRRRQCPLAKTLPLREIVQAPEWITNQKTGEKKTYRAAYQFFWRVFVSEMNEPMRLVRKRLLVHVDGFGFGAVNGYQFNGNDFEVEITNRAQRLIEAAMRGEVLVDIL